jgi:multidrug efflux pump subunit AcrA (membrane-fusion protein)
MNQYFILSGLLASLAGAGELTIKSEPLEATISVDVTFIPTEATIIRIEPKQWSSYKIEELVDHGTAVKKGDPLLTFDREDYQKHLAESKEAAKSRKIALANTERELADLKVTTPQSLEGLKLAHDRARESLDDFTKSGRALSEEDARERLESAKRSLSYYEEELKQLLKMYEEDGTTEETEEIILKRQRAAVKSAQFSLKKAEKNSIWTLEKTIPRQAVDLQRTFDAALLAYETGNKNLPRVLQEKSLSVAKALRDDAEADKKLAELEADGSFFSITAPADGIIYYGKIDDRSWSAGDTGKFLVKDGSAPSKVPLMSLIPAGTPLALHGSVSQGDRLQIPAEAKGTAEVEGLENSAYPVEVTSLDIAPNPAGLFNLGMKIDLPENSPIVTGMKAKVKLVTYRNEEAISVPKKAVTTKDGKSTVKIKMADGKDEVREVETGRAVDDKIEILKGLEIDQVILISEDAK